MAHTEGKLPVWIEGNAYLGGAKPSKKDVNALISAVAREDVRVELDSERGRLLSGYKRIRTDRRHLKIE